MVENGPRAVLEGQGPYSPPRSANDAAVREELHRLLADPLFHNSKRCSDMLQYIVDRTLAGEVDCLKERIIGIEVFARTPDYDTGADSIVRNAAAEIRKRLARFYQTADHSRSVHIVLPTGSYIPTFHPAEPPAYVAAPRTEPVETPPNSANFAASRRAVGPKVYLWVAIAALVLASFGLGAQRYSVRSSVFERFWAPILHTSTPVLILIGSPAPETPHPMPRGTSPAGTEPGLPLNEFIAQQTNFPIADLTAANGITLLLARRGTESAIQLSESTILADLHGNPVVILGSIPNEWALRLGTDLPFKFRADGYVHWIEDPADPSERKWQLNLRTPFTQVASEYTLITRCLDRTTGQWWIGIGGLSVLGTIAGQQMLGDPRAMASFTSQLPNGWDSKNLQIVLEIKMVNGSAGAGHIVAARSW